MMNGLRNEHNTPAHVREIMIHVRWLGIAIIAWGSLCFLRATAMDDPPRPKAPLNRAFTMTVEGTLPAGIRKGTIVDVIGEWDTNPKMSLTIHQVELLAVTSGSPKSEITLLMSAKACALHDMATREWKPKWTIRLHRKPSPKEK
jgi:hypothetical protein